MHARQSGRQHVARRPECHGWGTASYTVSVTNNDTSECSAGLFNLAATQPSGWQGTFSATSITANPGQTVSATLTETVPANASPGTYAVATTAANGAYKGSSTANLTVAAPACTPGNPTVTASPTDPSTPPARA